MKTLILTWALLVSSLVQAAPPTGIKGQDGTINYSVNAIVPYSQATKLAGNNVLIETGNANVLADPGAEALFTPWSAYKDAAGVLPVDGTGGTPDYISCINSSTSPLAGTKSFLITKQVAANAQGEGCSIPFTIPTSSTYKVNRLSFDYAIASGTYTDDQVEWFVYDVTNGVVKPFTPSKLKNHTLPSETFAPNGEFQASNSTSYRLIAHVASNSSASAWALKFDNFKLGVFEKTYGRGDTEYSAQVSTTGIVSAENRDWINGNCTVTATNLFTCSYNVGIVTSAMNCSVTTTQSINNNQSYGFASNSSTGFSYFTTSGGAANPIKASVSCQKSGTDYANASGLVMSNDADTRVVAAQIRGSVASVLANSPIILPTIDSDTHSSYNVSTGRYLALIGGYYRVSAYINPGTVAAATAIYISVDAAGFGANNPILGISPQANYPMNGSGVVKVNAGQYIDIRPSANISTVSAASFISIERISGPSQIAASESVSFSANTSTTAATTSAPFIYTVEDHDTHNAYSTVTGKFTAPSAGKYFCTFNTFSATSFYITLRKNGTTIYEGTNSGGSQSAVGSHVMSLLSGDTLEVRPSGAATAAGGADNNNFSCFRMGI